MLEPYPSPSVMRTLRCVANTTAVLRGLRDQLVRWQAIRQEQRQLLDSQDHDEYFVHRNNDRGFRLQDEKTRESILRGETYMVDKKSGSVILSTTEAKNILAEYPGYLIRRRVNTVSVPEYEGFDSFGRMIDSGSKRCCIATISHEEMLRVCHLRDQYVPIDIQARHPKRVVRTNTNNQQEDAEGRKAKLRRVD